MFFMEKKYLYFLINFIFHVRLWLPLKLHKLKGLENEIIKCHDFSRFRTNHVTTPTEVWSKYHVWCWPKPVLYIATKQIGSVETATWNKVGVTANNYLAVNNKTAQKTGFPVPLMELFIDNFFTSIPLLQELRVLNQSCGDDKKQ